MGNGIIKHNDKDLCNNVIVIQSDIKNKVTKTNLILVKNNSKIPVRKYKDSLVSFRFISPLSTRKVSYDKSERNIVDIINLEIIHQNKINPFLIKLQKLKENINIDNNSDVITAKASFARGPIVNDKSEDSFDGKFFRLKVNDKTFHIETEDYEKLYNDTHKKRR